MWRNALLVPCPPRCGPAMHAHTYWERERFFLNWSLFQLVEAHGCLALTDPPMMNWISSWSALDKLVIEIDGGLLQFLSRHPALEVSGNYVHLSGGRNSPLFIPPDNSLYVSQQPRSLISEAQNCMWVAGLNRSSHVSQQHLQEGFQPREAGEALYPPLNSPLVHTPGQHVLIRGGAIYEMDDGGACAAGYHAPAAWPRSLEDCELEKCKDAQRPELKSQSVVTCNTFIPSQSKTKMAEDEAPAPNAAKATVLFSSEDLGILKEDESIVGLVCKKVPSVTPESRSLGPSNESSQFNQKQVAVSCDTASGAVADAELPRCTSHSTQTEGLGKSDKNVNTELHMADLDFFTEDFIQRAKKELGDKQEKMDSRQDRNTIRKQEKNRTPAGKEVWYDAVSTMDSAAQVGQDKDRVNKEAKSSAWDFNQAIKTVDEAMAWFQACPATEGATSPSSDSRLARMTPDGPQASTSPGHTPQQHTTRGIIGSPSQVPTWTPRPESSSSSSSSSANLRSSVASGDVLSSSPSGRATFLPCHYGTMGSLDNMMVELARRHPGVGHQRILEALMQLKGEQWQSRCRLPLTTIIDMTSELLSRPAGPAQL